MPIPFLIPAIAAIAGGVINAVSSARQNKKTNQANMELAKYQADYNSKMIDKQNAYNSPASQMARYSDAGLNPDLIYGQGSSGNQSSPASYSPPTVDYQHKPFDLPQVIGQFQDLKMQQAQIDNVKANTEATRAEVANKVFRRLLDQVNINKKEFDLNLSKELRPYSVDIKKNEASQMGTKWNLMLEELKKVQGINPLLLEERHKDIQLKESKDQILKQEKIYQQLRNQMFKRGITPSDNIILRMLSRAISELGADDIQFDEQKLKRDLGITDH